METVTRVSRKRSHEEVYALGDDTEKTTAQLQDPRDEEGESTSPEPQTAMKKAKLEVDFPTPSASTDENMSVDEDEVEFVKETKKKDSKSAPAPILPGMTVANHTLPPSNTTTASTPPTKKSRHKLSAADKAKKAADAAQKALEKAQAAAAKEQAEREAADAMAAQVATAVGDQALAQALNDKQIAEEKAAKAKLVSDQAAEKAAKEQQLAKDLAQQAAEKQVKDAEKAKKALEKAEKEKRLAAEKPLRDAEKAKKDAEKTKKAAEKAEKEAEKLRKEEEKAKKAKSQPKLTFFGVTSTLDTKAAKKAPRPGLLRASQSPAPSLNSNADASEVDEPEAESQIPQYDLIFNEFFLKPETTLAPFTRFERDQETAQIVRTTIDSYLSGSRSPRRERKYDAVSLFHLARKPQRGRQSTNVKDLIAGITGRASHPIDLTIDDQNAEIIRSRDILKRTPMKLIQFQEDVRPPYRGTYTHQPLNGVHTLARNPFRKDLPDQNYDVDSEAEWVEEDEDAEDLKSDDDDDEEDDDEDMEDFLDDENDETAQAKRMLIQSDLEPVSTGLCWEDSHKRNTNVKMMPYRMEVILDHTIKSIDPFSTSYWEPSPKAKTMPPPRLPLNSMKPPNTKPAKTASVSKSFFTPGSSDPTPAGPSQAPSTSTKPSSRSDAPVKFIPEADMLAFRAAIEGSQLSKVGLIEKLKVDFPGRGALAIAATLMHVAQKAGKKKNEKHWVLKESSDAV